MPQQPSSVWGYLPWHLHKYPRIQLAYVTTAAPAQAAQPAVGDRCEVAMRVREASKRAVGARHKAGLLCKHAYKQ